MDRQKALLIFGIALGAALALTWFVYAKTQAPKVVASVRVLAAARDLPLGARLTRADLKVVSIPLASAPKGALTAAQDAADRVLLYPLAANEVLLGSRLASVTGAEGIPATIAPGRRAIAVTVNDASGVAGLVQPRSRVDVLFSKTGNLSEASTTTILEDIEVLSVGRLPASGQTIDPKTPRAPVATLLVTPEQARKLELAKNQGKISLALRNPLDRSTVADSKSVTMDALDPMIYARSARARRGLPPPVSGAPDIRNDDVWRELVGDRKAPPPKEPPKPKVVVDVFRGDKHVQEIFQ